MKYIGLYSSQNIDSCFKKYKVKNLLCFTKKEIPLRIGYHFINDTYVLMLLAVQMDNSATYETFELFDMDSLQAKTLKEIEDLARNIAEEIIDYNKEIVQYYFKKKCSHF